MPVINRPKRRLLFVSDPHDNCLDKQKLKELLKSHKRYLNRSIRGMKPEIAQLQQAKIQMIDMIIEDLGL